MAELRGFVRPSQWPWILDAGLGGCVWPWHGRCLPRASAALGGWWESTWGSLNRGGRGRSSVSRMHCGFPWTRHQPGAISQVAGDPLLRLGAIACGDEVSGMCVAWWGLGPPGGIWSSSM